MGICNNLFPFCIPLNVLWRKYFRNHTDSAIARHCKCNLPIGFIPHKYRLNVVPDIFGICWSIHYLYSIDYRFQANHNGTIPISYGTTIFLADIYPWKWNDVCIRRINNAELQKRFSNF